ncbi:hypothetical protein KM472_gp206 [Cynomolgus macaque cytomegalovirus strain Ottawa]|uniref:Uncharacterized protein n=1 Tax=macacine betaherpesvirus 8 TaxID=2560567 RepID=G8H0T5_9BETA|nr:hypothetical protein KM472_gp206 [Cynomolgus macaque cytomegalovirus strain Ottawa]AEQ32283.1 hypothetical protein cy194 [Cynomolgus macaque cytomegalovirus strain Ottawa]
MTCVTIHDNMNQCQDTACSTLDLQHLEPHPRNEHRCAIVRMLSTVYRTLKGWMQRFLSIFRRKRKQSQCTQNTATIESMVKTALSYSTSVSGHTMIDMEVDLCAFLTENTYTLQSCTFSEELTTLLAEKVQSVLFSVQAINPYQSSAEAKVLISNCPAALAEIMDDEGFSETMNSKFQAAFEHVLECA